MWLLMVGARLHTPIVGGVPGYRLGWVIRESYPWIPQGKRPWRPLDDFQNLSNRFLNALILVAFTTSLGNKFQFDTTRAVKQYFLTSNREYNLKSWVGLITAGQHRTPQDSTGHRCTLQDTAGNKKNNCYLYMALTHCFKLEGFLH